MHTHRVISEKVNITSWTEDYRGVNEVFPDDVVAMMMRQRSFGTLNSNQDRSINGKERF